MKQHMTLLFSELEVGEIFEFQGKRIVKISDEYFLIRPNKNGAGSRMVNAMIEETGELTKIDNGLCVTTVD